MSKRFAAATVLALALAFSGGALAGTSKPAAATAPPGVSQYVEVIPTAGGATPADRRTGKSSSLSPKAEAALQRSGGADAALLEKVATSTGYGAPARRAAKPAPKTLPTGSRSGSTNTHAAAAPIVAVTDSSYSSRSWWVLAALVAIALAGVAATVVKTRRPT